MMRKSEVEQWEGGGRAPTPSNSTLLIFKIPCLFWVVPAFVSIVTFIVNFSNFFYLPLEGYMKILSAPVSSGSLARAARASRLARRRLCPPVGVLWARSSLR